MYLCCGNDEIHRRIDVISNDLMSKQYVLGRNTGEDDDGVLRIGRFFTLDSSLGASVSVDVLHPHVILICGKRGYGKSYTMGVFIEEIAKLDKKLREHLSVVIIDTLGVFWTMQFPNTPDRHLLEKWMYTSDVVTFHLFVPKKSIDQYRKMHVEAQPLVIKVSELTPIHWCQLFNIKPTDPPGMVITKAVLQLQKQFLNYSISKILEWIKMDTHADNIVKGVAENFLTFVESWEIFDETGITVTDIVKKGGVTIIDLSHLDDDHLKMIIASLIGDKIFEARVRSRKNTELQKMGEKIDNTPGIPMVWLAIDEAQLFLPADDDCLSKKIFIGKWMRQGRQPGLSLLLATQRPSFLDQEVLSHCDLIFCHRLTSQDDIDSLSKLRPAYMSGEIEKVIKKIGKEKGVALVIDDTSESAHIIKIRPRLTWHGGADSMILDAMV